MKRDTFLCVVIPVYNEMNLLDSLNSLVNCNKPEKLVELIIVVNHSENDSSEIKEQNKITLKEIEAFKLSNQFNWLSINTVAAFDLPQKKAGVGLARKIGMDEAAYRFNQIDEDGIIICFDADSIADENYLIAIETAFLKNDEHLAASIHFEHPLYLPDGAIHWPIVNYELHLRYYIQALAFTNYPFAFHTIGSSMVARSSTYQKAGGMNTRKAGEDFYFLHKIIPLGGFINITNTTITPSARESNRVPFGTGKAILLHYRGDKLLGYTYNFKIFQLIKTFFELTIKPDNGNAIPPLIQSFLVENKLDIELNFIRNKSKNSAHFKDRFFQWFNGFKVLKCVHYLRDHAFPDIAIEEAVKLLIENDSRLLSMDESLKNSKDQLIHLRRFEKSLNYTT